MMRVIAQRVDSASLLLDNVERFGSIRAGVVLYVSFLQGATAENVTTAVTSLLSTKIFSFDIPSDPSVRVPTVSVGERKVDVLVIPQASIAGKIKGKAIQYHGQAPKEDTQKMYEAFCAQLRHGLGAVLESDANGVPLVGGSGEAAAAAGQPIVVSGTFGNRQALKMDSPGPMTHFFEF
eukprot:PhM_4_TR11773/c0_g1_i1/m.25418